MEGQPITKGTQERRYEEYLKLIYDISKHHTTLSTVTAAVVGGLFQDSFKQHPYPVALLAALILLAISVGLAVIAMVFVADLMKGTEVRNRLPTKVYVLHWCMTAAVVAALVLFGVHVFWPS